MKLFLRRIFFLIVPIAFICCVVEYAIRQIPNAYKIKAEYLRENSNAIETLILGSSHTFYGVNPIFFESETFNASNISQSPDVDFAILKSQGNKLKSLEVIILRLSYDTLFEQLKDSPEDWRLKDYNLYTDVNFDYSLKHNSELLSSGARQALKVLKGYYIDKEPILNCDNLGWGNDLSKRLEVNLNNAGKLAALRHTIEDWELLDENINVFRDLIKWSQNKGINIILVTPPAYKSYRDNLNKDQYNEVIRVGKVLDSEFTNCTYYNYMSHPGFSADDFYDADHLNSLGAKKFSLILNDLIEN
ncbi:hypothetical protein [Winogradskyella sp. PG-2]|uniref:hypothetical protein n=1 Tax=Winogradskyella sp. PG-2 TaxID=754409 RepID=UPI0004588813|nr:hypothetical protein [Winogradskyella sp. PG-2]BAO76630.1 hypothetical protein WPG_2400 [Winogradskyella sp. PG-2]